MRDVLDAIEAALDAAAQGGHGSVVVLHGRAHRVADALERLEAAAARSRCWRAGSTSPALAATSSPPPASA